MKTDNFYAICFLGLCALMLVGCEDSPSTDLALSTSISGSLVFQSDRDGSFDVFRVTGQTLKNISLSEAQDFGPHIAGNGKSVVFLSNRSGTQQVYEYDGGPVTAILDSSLAINEIKLSHDGQTVIVVRDFNIWSVDKQSGQLVNLTLTNPDSVSNFNPSLSSSGNLLVFSRSIYGSQADLYLLNIGSGDVSNLTNGVDDNTGACFSANEESLIYVGGNHIKIMELATLSVTDLTPNDSLFTNASPVFSPDGSKIAFASNRSGNWEIYSMNKKGGNLRNLTDHPGLDTSPSWGN